MKRALSSFLLLFLVAAPSAHADGFREAEVRKALSGAGFGSVAGKVAGASRPTVTVGLTQLSREPDALGTSRFGGRPDLPEGADWPRCKRTNQSFIAQVRVRDLPGAARELRRLGGTLLFFTHVGFEPGEREYGLWAGDCTTVLHAPKGATLTRTQFPGGVLELTPSRPRFTVRPDIPDLTLDGDFLMGPLHDVEIAEWERWFDFRHALNGKPKLEHRVLGYGSAPNGGDDCSLRQERARDTWRHLFTIGPDDDLGFSVADAGRLQILISPADLRKGRFDHVCGTFDSA